MNVREITFDASTNLTPVSIVTGSAVKIPLSFFTGTETPYNMVPLKVCKAGTMYDILKSSTSIISVSLSGGRSRVTWYEPATRSLKFVTPVFAGTKIYLRAKFI